MPVDRWALPTGVSVSLDVVEVAWLSANAQLSVGKTMAITARNLTSVQGVIDRAVDGGLLLLDVLLQKWNRFAPHLDVGFFAAILRLKVNRMGQRSRWHEGVIRGQARCLRDKCLGLPRRLISSLSALF